MPTGIKVALIDDSAVVRKHLTDQPSEAGIEVLSLRKIPCLPAPTCSRVDPMGSCPRSSSRSEGQPARDPLEARLCASVHKQALDRGARWHAWCNAWRAPQAQARCTSLPRSMS